MLTLTEDELEELIVRAVQTALNSAQPLPVKMLFTATEAAAITGLPKSFFEEGSAAGHIPSRKIGKYRRFTLADIEFVLDAAAVPSARGPLHARWLAKQRANARRKAA
jgi:hypothetical protein